jgi:cobalt-zinc-cadmium efflux system outer membrane protein
MSEMRHDAGAAEGEAAMNRALAGFALATFALSGSAEAETRVGAGSMPRLVRDRTGVEVPWSPDGRQQPALGDTIRALLEGDLTADRAVRVALLNNQSLRAEFEEIGISRADFRQALLPRNPIVEGEVRFDGGRHPGELAVMQDLSSMLLSPLRRQAAGAALQRADFIAAHAALGVVRETRSAFYGVQAAEQIRRFWEQIASAAQAAADLARRQHGAGNVSDRDLENQQALYERAKIELAKTQSDALAARERLNRTMGTWGEQTAWEAVDDLPVIPADTTSLTGLESIAISQRLDLAAAGAEVRAFAKTVTLARFAQFPELRAGVHFEREPEGTRTTGPAVELALPLFDRGQHAVARAEAQLRQAQGRYAALAVAIRSEVRAARDRLTAARQLAEYYRDVVLPRRERIVEQTQREYNFMLVGVFQLLQGKQDEINAQREYLEAQRDYWIAWAELDHALGGGLVTAGAK